jgi:hypothetical protein
MLYYCAELLGPTAVLRRRIPPGGALLFPIDNRPTDLSASSLKNILS